MNCSGGKLKMEGGSIANNTSKDIKVKDTDLVGGGGLFNYNGLRRNSKVLPLKRIRLSSTVGAVSATMVS